MEIEWTCYKCGCDSTNKILVAVRAPGVWYICNECIVKQEEETGQVAVLSYSRGLFFTSQEEADKLITKDEK